MYKCMWTLSLSGGCLVPTIADCVVGGMTTFSYAHVLSHSSGCQVTTIPNCVLGGMTTFLFANVAVSGIKVRSVLSHLL